MKNIPRIDSSLFAKQGVSSQLADELIDSLTQGVAEVNVTSRDLNQENTPRLDSARLTVLATAAEKRTAEQAALVDYSDQLIAEAQVADTLVPYVKTMLAFIGITDVRVIYAEGLNMGDSAREQGIADARQVMQQLSAA